MLYSPEEYISGHANSGKLYRHLCVGAFWPFTGRDCLRFGCVAHTFWAVKLALTSQVTCPVLVIVGRCMGQESSMDRDFWTVFTRGV